MRHIKTIISGGALALFASIACGLFGINGNIAHAADCTISGADVAQITIIQNDPTLSYFEEIQQELALRKKLVGQTIACADQDVQSLQTTLKGVSVDDHSQVLQSQFLGKLSDATNYYAIELTKLNSSGIAGTQAIAKEILDWRKNSFVPLTEQISNFILWTKNQPLFDTAQTRIDQTSRAVTFLESASSNTDLQTAFNASLASFNTAQSQNAAAKASLSQISSADESLSLIKESLDSLSTTYQDFSKVSTIIKKIIP